TAVVDAEGNWTVTFADVPAGDHNVVATQDVDGSTAEVAFTTAAPAAVAPVSIDSPTAGQDLGETGSVPVSGKGEPGATVTVVLDG
ncbi:hypothetical protein ACIPVK_21875, partial [Paeniglutamicibacter sp. MACA_103]|uniref:hypothetical protein n=1 Tax=Paeniglutamicibacter sp. MACA_103 TaxID=3377337 RepID=UPI0038947184